MIQLSPQQTLFLAVQPIDFRKGITSLMAVCQQQLCRDPFSGGLFVFTNRCKTAVKLLSYDGNGFWLCQKRFSKGKLAWWPASPEKTTTVRADELRIVLAQGSPLQAALPQPWRHPTQAPVPATVPHNSTGARA